MSRMGVKLIKPPQMSHTCGKSKPCQSAQTSELYIYIYIFFQPMEANRLSKVTGFRGTLEILSAV